MKSKYHLIANLIDNGLNEEQATDVAQRLYVPNNSTDTRENIKSEHNATCQTIEHYERYREALAKAQGAFA